MATALTFLATYVPPAVAAGKGVVPNKRQRTDIKPDKENALKANQIAQQVLPLSAPLSPPNTPTKRKAPDAPSPPSTPLKTHTASPFQSPEAPYRKNPQIHYSKDLRNLTRKAIEAINGEPVQQVKKDKVFLIQKDNVPIAYFKINKSDSTKPTSITEVLMWRISQIFGWEKYFAPTVQTSLPIPGYTSVNGSLQPAVAGTLMHTMIKKNKSGEIPLNSLLVATVIATIEAMWDFHDLNGIFGLKKHIHFFDNCRSLAHSILFITRPDGKINSPLRICLNFLPQSWESLNNEQLIEIKTMVEEAKEVLPKLREFFKSPEILKNIQALPPNWVIPDLILDSMEMRIANIEKALSEKRIRNLADISLCSCQGYRIALGLTLASRLLEAKTTRKDNLQKYLHYFTDLGWQPLDNEIEVFNKHGLKLIDVYNLCSTERPFLEIIQGIRNLVFNNKMNTNINFENVAKENNDFFETMRKISQPDWKDFSIARQQTKSPIPKVKVNVQSSSKDEEVYVKTEEFFLPTQLDITPQDLEPIQSPSHLMPVVTQ